MTNKIKAELWKREVCNSSFERVHGGTFQILEIYIPKFNISVNLADNRLHVFRTNIEIQYTRNDTATKIKNIEILKTDALLFQEIVKVKEEIERHQNEFKKYFKL